MRNTTRNRNNRMRLQKNRKRLARQAKQLKKEGNRHAERPGTKQPREEEAKAAA